MLVPWRWALGDRPFVDEQNLTQSAGLLAYPFVKLFALVRGGDVAGLVLYERHLYLALAVIVAACVFLLARRSLSASLAALVAAPFVTVVLFETPQLTANTLGALLLVAGAALGAVAVLGGRRRYALAAGIAFGLACVAYPTVVLMMPFVAVFLAFSVGERTVVMVARGSFLASAARRARAHRPRARGVRSARGRWAALVVVLPVRRAGRSRWRARQSPALLGLHHRPRRPARPAGGTAQGGRGGRGVRRSPPGPVVHRRRRGRLAAGVPRPPRSRAVAAAAHAAGPLADRDDESAARVRRRDRLRPGGAVSVPVRAGRAQGGRRAAAPVGVGSGAAGGGDDGVHERRRVRPCRRRAAARHGGERPVPGLGARTAAEGSWRRRGRPSSAWPRSWW